MWLRCLAVRRCCRHLLILLSRGWLLAWLLLPTRVAKVANSNGIDRPNPFTVLLLDGRTPKQCHCHWQKPRQIQHGSFIKQQPWRFPTFLRCSHCTISEDTRASCQHHCHCRVFFSQTDACMTPPAAAMSGGKRSPPGFFIQMTVMPLATSSPQPHWQTS